MGKPLLVVVGVLVAAAGVIWTLQGLGYIGGSVMTGVTLWAVVGPVVAVAGAALAGFGGFGGFGLRVRGRRSPPVHDPQQPPAPPSGVSDQATETHQ